MLALHKADVVPFTLSLEGPMSVCTHDIANKNNTNSCTNYDKIWLWNYLHLEELNFSTEFYNKIKHGILGNQMQPR